MTFVTVQFLLLTSQKLEAQQLMNSGGVEIKVTAHREIGVDVTNPAEEENLEQSIVQEFIQRTQTLCASIDLEPKALHEPIIHRSVHCPEFFCRITFLGTQTFRCVPVENENEHN